jgi:dipeptidyl aminopeptidase/acylaminoacyl peptidase
VRQAEQLRDALRAKGVRVEAEIYPNKGHAATVAGFSKPARGSAPILDETVTFLGSLTASTATAQTDR